MKNFSVRKKLALTFAIVLVLNAGTLAFSFLFGMRSVSDSFSGFYSGPYQIVSTTVDLRRAAQTVEKDILRLLNDEDHDNDADYKEELQQNADAFASDLDFLNSHLTSDQDVQDVQTMLSIEPACKKARDQIVQYFDQGKTSESYQVYKNTYEALSKQNRDLAKEISSSAQARGDAYFNNAKVSQTRASVIIIVFFVVTVALTVVLCAYIIRSIVRPVEEIKTAAGLLADGKLDADVRYTSRDEMGSLADSIRTLIRSLRSYISDISKVLGLMSGGDMTAETGVDYKNDFEPIRRSMEQIIQSLNETISQINVSTEQVATGAEQMSEGAQSLSQGTTEQASSVEELAAGINEITAKVKSSAAGAKQASDEMQQTLQEIQQGDQQMKKLVGAMQEIADTSGQIQKIIKTIDDIAFQTNILALNAAVEAARAGSAGKGFAVVADEVRNLAGKSAEAAKDTTDLINSTLSAVGNGNAMVGETEKSLTRIAEKAGEVSVLVQNIADMSESQATTIGQIDAGINQISGVVQMNSATAEESAASSEELSSQAVMLQELVSHFKLKK